MILRSHIAEPVSLRRIALEEFTRRRADLRLAAQQRLPGWTPSAANDKAALWLAIAIAAGVGRDLPEDVCAAIEVECIHPFGHKYLPTADRIAEPAAYRAELARARDTARTKAEGSADQRLIQRALDLTALAEALGAPPVEWHPARKEAA
jgi:hypothetical protein